MSFFYEVLYALLYGYSRYYVSAEDTKESVAGIDDVAMGKQSDFYCADATSSLRQCLITSVKQWVLQCAA